MSIRNKRFYTFLGAGLFVLLLGTITLRLYWEAAETSAVTEAQNIATTLAEYIFFQSGMDTRSLDENQDKIQKFVMNLHNRLRRDFEVVDVNKKIVADVIVGDIGHIVAFDEVEKTMKDGIPRTFVEVSKSYPKGIKQVVVPISGKSNRIMGAVIFEYTPLYLELTVLTRKGATIIILLSLFFFASIAVLGVYVSNSFNAMAVSLSNVQEELVRQEKLAALGKIAGVVGHEIRNPLGVISNAVFYLKTVQADADDTVREYLEMIQAEVVHADRIVSDLLDFARTKTPNKSVMPVGGLIAQTLRKCGIPENVRVETDIPEPQPHVNVDSLQIGQVFSNIIRNAVEMMPKGGDLTIRVKEDRETGFLRVSIRDTGPGISPEGMSRLFQPLFTTKAKGLGLGLTVVKNLTEANGGRVEVESAPEKGTTFTVVLPADSVPEGP